jgi:hypothetical protein
MSVEPLRSASAEEGKVADVICSGSRRRGQCLLCSCRLAPVEQWRIGSGSRKLIRGGAALALEASGEGVLAGGSVELAAEEVAGAG